MEEELSCFLFISITQMLRVIVASMKTNYQLSHKTILLTITEGTLHTST